MSDRIAVFDHGRIEQVGTPDEIYERPATPFVAGFVGTSNLLRPEAAADAARQPRHCSRSARRRSGSPSGPGGTEACAADGSSPRRLRRAGDPLRRRLWTPAADWSSCSRTPTRRTALPPRHAVRLAWDRAHAVALSEPAIERAR